MLMPPFELHKPTTVEEACEIAAQLLESGQEFDWIAGGTDIIPNYKWHINTKPHVISLAGIEGVSTISMNEIGCMARLHDISVSSVVHPLIAEAASKVASSLIRRNATLGGNLCLDTRCFWYNQAEEWRSSIDWCHNAVVVLALIVELFQIKTHFVLQHIKRHRSKSHGIGCNRASNWTKWSETDGSYRVLSVGWND